MAARRCVLHGNFPNNAYRFMYCPVCNELTHEVQSAEPDEYWEENVKRHKARNERAEEVPSDIPVLEDARVQLEGDEYFISTWDVVNGGVRHRLRDTDLIQVGQQVFEILHYSYELRRYYAQPFSTTLSNEDLGRLAGP